MSEQGHRSHSDDGTGACQSCAPAYAELSVIGSSHSSQPLFLGGSEAPSLAKHTMQSAEIVRLESRLPFAEASS